MEWFCGLVVVAILVGAVVLACQAATRPRLLRPFRYCPGCGAETFERDEECPRCGLVLDGRRAHDLHRVRVAEREIRALVDAAKLDPTAAEPVLDQLEARARALRGMPAKLPRATPVAPAPPSEVAPAGAAELVPAAEGGTPAATPVPLADAVEEAPIVPVSPPTPPSPTPAPPEPVPPSEPVAPHTPIPPRRRLSHFLEEHNILWGELVGGLLIVGCSIALVVTLRQTLEALPYFRFLLSAAVALALFGAGQYTLHRWKLAGTSRGMLVIALLLAPLTLLLLTDPFTHGASGPLDVGVKLASLAAFVGVVRTGGRDLIGTEHLPGPIDRRWLIALAVVGAAATQLLPAPSAWLPLLCFVVACGATLGGLSWYHPGRHEEPISDRSGTALLTFVGLAAFALLTAWGLYLVRAIPTGGSPRDLALPLALACVPVVEAGVLVLRRVTSSAGLRTVGTATALVGFVGTTASLALAWPDPLIVLLVAAAAGAFLTRVAFRERLPWVQAGAIPLLALAAVIGFHGLAGNWPVPAEVGASGWLAEKVGASESGAVLAGFALLLALGAELLAGVSSRQTRGYTIGALGVGAVALLLVSAHGVEHPATAAAAHLALALGLLATNYRYTRRAPALAGLWLLLAGSLWALWWLAPRQPDLWGFVVAAEALVFAAGAVTLRGARRSGTALLRRAARDVAFAACALAVILAATSGRPELPWHARTLVALAGAFVALARLTGSSAFTWAGSVALLLGLVHLGVFVLDPGSNVLAVELGLLAHATAATIAAVACRRQRRAFGDPFRLSARLSSVLAMPLLFFPPAGLAVAYAPLAVWLGAVWLALALLWREHGAFAAFQGALTLAALLAAFAWVEQRPWWEATSLGLRDPRALHAFGLALGLLALAWIVVRRALRRNTRARELWCDDPLSLDRLVLAATVAGFLLLNVVAAVPGVRAELTPLGFAAPIAAPPELAHAFGPTAWVVFALLAGAVMLSWRLSNLETAANPHALGLGLLVLAAPVVWAGAHAPEVAAASALRWGLAIAFAVGSAALALRTPIRRAATATGFPAQPEPWLRPSLLVLFAVAAGVVVMLSVSVTDIGLRNLTPTGPDPRSVFALMGTIASNLVPLALVVIGLATTAGRERSPGYGLSGGLVFVATATAGYALAVVTAGKPLDGTEQTRLLLITATSAAVWALAWLASARRVPGGTPLTVQVCLGFGALGLLCFIPAIDLIARADEPLPAAFDPLGQLGWLALAAVSAAGVWHIRRAAPALMPLVSGFAALVVGAIAGAGVRALDEPDRWLSFHALALVWAGAAFALFRSLRRGAVAHAVVGTFAALLVVCALRGGWYDPWRPWLSAALSLSAALLFGGIALRTRLAPLAVVSGLAVNLAAVFVWVAWGPDTFTGFVLANAAGLAAAVAVWTLVRIRQAPPESADWLRVLDFAPAVVVALFVVGLVPALGGEPSNPRALTWGATVAVALAGVIGLWDRFALLARPALYATGALAVLLGAVEVDRPRPMSDTPLSPLALAVFALAVAAFAVAVTRRGRPLLRMPENRDWRYWLPGAQTVVATVAVILCVRIGLFGPSVWERLAGPLAVVLLAPAFALLARIAPRRFRTELRTFAAVLVALVPAAVAWAVPDPNEPFAWLHRNGWLFVALVVAAVVGSEVAARLDENWRRVARTAAGWTAAGAVVVLCVNLLQQVPVYDPAPDVKRTPLAREAAVAMLVGIGVLIALAIRFALRPERDPFELRPSRRTGYVYLAEVLLVLFFTQIRFNLPELFPRELAAFWTFVVMALAYIGIGLAELFERRKLDVLAMPLRRTGVLLPLIPLIAFWAKPPAFVNEFATETAPGLVPFLNYLKNLPQHFDIYAWLWFLAGGVYGLVALSRKSFGWALLAALATNAAMWSLLTHHEVPFFVHPQAWVIPLALIVLVSEHVNRHRLTAEASNAMRYAGVAMIYVASAADMFIAGVGNSTWLPVILAALCVAGVLGGILLRVRAFIYLGVGFLLLDLFSMIWYAAVDLQQTWVWYASGIVLGAAVLGLFAYLEKRRTHAKEPAESETAGE